MPISAVSIAIPTLDRGSILVDTLDILLASAEAEEILVVDQTASHPPEIAAKLKLLDKEGRIRWVRLERPSIPHAMNVALEAASQDIVLFLVNLPSKAMQWYDQLLEEHPESSLREEIFAQKVFLADDQGKAKLVRNAGEIYLHEYPEGQWRAEVSAVLGMESLAREDYVQAIQQLSDESAAPISPPY